ncbi:uncharacterized protein UTRI_00591_B [Ustilago trichophora]|uniref:Uncharacterized protein n=1 Tax=Ustilago trichophora TaxID=86804 RepID=A0A5C3DT71_9BASI|nr:uncharacterized protein UTRI_00591_B [Ustilago trichophora]
MQSFSSSTLSLPAGAEKKSKRNILRRLSLGKPKTSSSSSNLGVSSSSANLTSRSTATLAVPPSEESASRRAFDLFSSGPSRPIVDAYASMPSTPRTPKTPTHSMSSKLSFDTRSLRPSVRSRSASSAARTSTSSRTKNEEEVPPVPQVPKMFLISDEVFVIAPSASSSKARTSESSSVPTSSPMLPSSSSVSHRSSGSWLDNLGSPSSEDTPTFPRLSKERVAFPTTNSIRSRSSLDEIDDQMLLNLCEVPAHKRKSTRSNCGHSSTPTRPSRGHARSASQQASPPPVPTIPASYARAHARSGSAPLSLGPLPPQPDEPPTEAVLRRTSQIKKRYSRQGGSPLLTSNSPLMGHSEGTFTSPRQAPSTPKLDSVSSLRNIEAGLSLDSKMVRRNHKRSVSKGSGSKSLDSSFAMLKDVKLTPGHIATPTQEEPRELVSRFSEDSDSGSDDPRRLLSLLSPVLGSVAKMPPFLSNNTPSTATIITTTTAPSSDTHDSRRNSGISGSKTPDMVAARTSSSSSSSYSDLSEIISADETVFDLSRKSLDYKTVYALAQEYAKSSNSISSTSGSARSPDMAKLGRKKLPTPPSAKGANSGFSLWSGRAQRQLPDPVDRSYHLRKY